MKKTIEFIPETKETELNDRPPKPSLKFLPAWYKSIPPFGRGDKKLRYPVHYGMPNVTIKKCMPFLDALTEGYMVTLDEDVYVELIDGKPLLRWRSADVLITEHTPDQFEGIPIPSDYHYLVYKWNNFWGIKVPKGYSVMFNHPLNRFDLPFKTISGVVDCDSFILSVKFPFILQKNFEGIIEAGTPICQLTVIKREQWKSLVHKFSKENQYKKFKDFYQTFISSYKKNYWTRKYYE